MRKVKLCIGTPDTGFKGPGVAAALSSGVGGPRPLPRPPPIVGATAKSFIHNAKRMQINSCAIAGPARLHTRLRPRRQAANP